MKKFLLPFILALGVLVLVNVLGSFLYARWDVTEDERYTLSEAAINTVVPFDSPVTVQVLLDGDLPAEFLKLKTETRQLLEEFAAENSNISFYFEDPLANSGDTNPIMAQLQSQGITPAGVTIEDNGKVSQELLYPWAILKHNEKTINIRLLKDKLGATSEDRVNNSVQHLEYAFADAFMRLKLTDKKQVAVIKGNGELQDIYVADYLRTIQDYYNIAAFTLDSVASNPQKTLDHLKTFDLALIAKPTEAFSDAEKYVLDQYMVQGGSTMWLIDQVAMELDSLFNEKGTNLAYPRKLKLDDLFFNYGLRLNAVLVNDMYCSSIVLAKGEGNSSEYNPVPWVYNPMVFSRNTHPINKNLEALRFQFAGSIDTLANENQKTILYSSSPLSRPDATPKQISFEILNRAPDKAQYTQGKLPLAVLVEGKFKSAYRNRVKPLKLTGTQEQGEENKMLVVADGDIIKNQIRQGRPLELGYDKWTNNSFGNKEFLVNSINYLLDDAGLINIRNKNVAIPFLDQEKIAAQKTKWQLINVVIPVVLTILLGLFFNMLRKKKYGA